MAASDYILQSLLDLCWQSPVFHDSYPAYIEHDVFVERLRNIHSRLTHSLAPILALGMPDVPLQRHDELSREIAPKVSAFCAAIAVEITDTEALTAAVTCLAIMYWADSLADRGDMAMAQAIQTLTAPGQQPLQDPVSRARLAALEQLKVLSTTISHPEDSPYLIEFPGLAFLRHGAATRELSHRYFQLDPAAFWPVHAEEFALHTIANIQTAGTAALIYTLYRQLDSRLPSVATLLTDPHLSQLYWLIDAGLRVFEDVGDWEIDRGDSDWNGFHLNLFNQPDVTMLRAYLRLAGIGEAQLVEELVHMFQAQTLESRTAIVEIFIREIRNRVLGLPDDVQQRYNCVLILIRRIVESGYINCLGDVALAEC